MKLLRAKKSTTFKTHFFSALCRSLFTNTSLIFANSVFVKSAGAENYSRLFFFASLAALIYYIFFAIAGDKQAYSVYKAVIGLTLLASILCFLEPFWPPLEPYNIPLLYFFAVAVMVVDLIGTTVGPVVLQLSVNPAIFREVFQKIVTAELLARISAAGLIWVLSINHWLVFWYPIGWLTLVIHFVLFQVTLIRLRRVERSDKESVEQRDVVLIIGSSLKFVLTNPMVRVAMSIMMWGNVTKFVIECLFYHVADDRFSSARQIASFMSVVTMTMIILSLVVQHLMGKKLIRRLQLSTLFSFQPVNILILGCIALMIQPFWPVVVLLVTYTIINRSIQLPVSRQCLVPVPRGQRSTIVSLICINMSIATLLASGILAVMKSSLALQDFLVVLLVLGGGIFFLITGLDSYYIRNLWSFYRESRSGHWQDEPVTESLTSVELDLPGTIETPFQFGPGADWKSHVILDTYSTSFDRFRLAQASRAHKQLLGSGDTQVVLLGLRICFVAGFPWFTSIFKKSLSHDCKEVRNFARQAIWVQESFADLSGYSSVFRRKLRSLALEFVEDASGSGNVTRLRELTNLPDHQAAESMVAALSESRFLEIRDTLFDCIIDGGKKLTLKPIVERMFESSYDDARKWRELLLQLSFGRHSFELLGAIETSLNSLEKSKLALDSAPPHRNRDQLLFQRFLHTLFAEEYRLCPNDVDRALTDTIGEFQSLPPEDGAMLVDMHLEFLKRSELFKSWRVLMA